MGAIRRPSDSDIGGTKGVEFIWYTDGGEPQIYKIWCLGSDCITHEVHLTAWIYVSAETIGQF